MLAGDGLVVADVDRAHAKMIGRRGVQPAQQDRVSHNQGSMISERAVAPSAVLHLRGGRLVGHPGDLGGIGREVDHLHGR